MQNANEGVLALRGICQRPELQNQEDPAGPPAPPCPSCVAPKQVTLLASVRAGRECFREQVCKLGLIPHL